jgi:hypothetical protein
MNGVAERKAQRKAYRLGTAVEKAEKLEKEEAELESALSAVRSKLAKVTHKPVEPRPSSSAQKVTIQPGKQSDIFLKAPGDAAHQITFNFREPEGSGKLPKDSTSSIPVYTVLVDTLATGASLEEYATAMVNSTYQFLLQTHGIAPHPTDMGRCVLISAHLKGRVSTGTVSITELSLALQTTVSNVLQSPDEFDVSIPLEIEFQHQLNSNRGHSSIRFRRLQVEDFLAKATLGFVDPELNFTEGMCMLMSTLMATVRSVRIDLGVAVPLPFLPIEDLEGAPDIDPSMVCRAVDGNEGGDYAVHYYKFSRLCHYVWGRIRTKFVHEDASLHLATVPSQMQEKHLAHLATYMGVCIHILCFDAMGREIAKYGDHRGNQHLYSTDRLPLPPCLQGALFACIWKRHPTPSNWCDYCSKLVGTNGRDGIAHIQKCVVRAKEDAATTLERVFLAKWHAKHQATFRCPMHGKLRQGNFCFLCERLRTPRSL